MRRTSATVPAVAREGKCEVADIWACLRTPEAVRGGGHGLDGPVVFNNNLLRLTSAWANTFVGRDHIGRPAAGQETAQ